jgi:hypothetical protein
MAVSTPQEIVLLRVPSLSGDPRLGDFETLAKGQTGTAFGDCYNLAVALRMLHWLTLDARAGAAIGAGASTGGVKSEKEGDLSRSYGTTASAIAERYPDLSQSIYGLELIQLQKSCLMLPRNRMVGPGDGTTHTLPTVL